jgi:peroxiredoxin
MPLFRCLRRLDLPGLAALLVISLTHSSEAQLLKTRQSVRVPEFRDVTTWINSEPLTMAKLRGKVVVVHFWTNGCFNCMNNYAHYRAWQERYANKDVVIVGIHTPETEGERNIKGIKAQAAKNGLKFPIAVDNSLANWRAWENQVWPTVYVVDRRGTVRYGWEGELSYKGAPGEETVRKAIDTLLLEKP